MAATIDMQIGCSGPGCAKCAQMARRAQVRKSTAPSSADSVETGVPVGSILMRGLELLQQPSSRQRHGTGGGGSDWRVTEHFRRAFEGVD